MTSPPRKSNANSGAKNDASVTAGSSVFQKQDHSRVQIQRNRFTPGWCIGRRRYLAEIPLRTDGRFPIRPSESWPNRFGFVLRKILRVAFEVEQEARIKSSGARFFTGQKCCRWMRGNEPFNFFICWLRRRI